MPLFDWSPASSRRLSKLSAVQRSLGAAMVITGVVLALESLMHSFGFFVQDEAVWWPTNGLALAAMLRSDRRRWPIVLGAVLLASSLGEVYYGYHLPSITTTAVANAVGPLIGALALPPFRQLKAWMQVRNLVARFTVFALLLAPIVSATIFAAFTHYAWGMDFRAVFRLRAVSDMLGYALFTPLALVLSSRETYKLIRPRELPRTVMLLIVVTTVEYGVFRQSSFSLAFVVSFVLLLVMLQLGFGASVLCVNLLAVIATFFTMHGHGPLVLGGGSVLTYRIIVLQFFLTLSMLTVFSVAVIQIEREVFQAQLKGMYQEMERLATTDALTGAGNRRRFDESLKIEWARAYRSDSPLALLMIDVDHFKQYNDVYGHPAGDACLVAVARAMQTLERRSMDLLARYGGEEFALLLPMSSAAGAANIAEEIRSSVAAIHEQAGTPILRAITVSIGCAAMSPGSEPDPRKLIEAADAALYQAKKSGRNRVEIA